MVQSPSRPEPDMLSELRARFRGEQIASWIAATGVLILTIAYAEPWGVLLVALIGLMAVLRLPAFGALDRRDIVAAMWWEAAGSWGIALVVAGLIPDALPIMVLNLVGPLVTGAMFLDARSMRRLILAGGIVAVALGAVGFRSEGPGLEDAVPEWSFHLILIVYLAAHVIVMSAVVSSVNRVRLANLAEIGETNRALLIADAELRASRRRVIAAGDDERVRLERNIHDGAQQRLVALAVQLQLAEQLTRHGTPASAEQLGQLHRESRDAIDELRELARGVYPSILTERGLADALRSVAERSPVAVDVDYDASVEFERNDAAAVYFICLEALQNAAKHAPESSARLSVTRSPDGGSVIRVCDDGPGFDASASNSRGLLNMADRAAALGGELSIESGVGCGTRIMVVLPAPRGATVGT
jgi:signal transduction histidine kinase